MRMRGPLKRLFVSTDAVGGVWRYSMELCSAWSASGLTTTLAVVGPNPTDAQRREAAAIPRLDLIETGLPLDWTARHAATLEEAAHALAGMAESCGADSVHLHAPAFVGEARWHTPAVAVIHSCLLTWWHAMREAPAPPEFSASIGATAKGLRTAGAVIAPSRAFANAVRSAYRLSRSVAVVHNGRRPMALPDRVRESGVFAAGRLWDDAKNIRMLDSAAAGLAAHVGAAGALAAPGDRPVRLSHIRHAGVLNEVELASHLAGNSVFAGLSLYEPFGLSVLEAAQSGMALVLADIPVFRELWDGAAIFVDGRDVDSIRLGLTQALLEPAPLARLASIRALAFDSQTMAATTLAVHAGLCNVEVCR
jgi:glycosyltransferase involved in cell wall biosynthesis